MVDLDVLRQYGRAAVFCETKEQAEQFMEAMWEQYPKQVESAWYRGETNWVDGNDGIYYLPRIFHTADSGEYSICQSSNLRWVTKHNYTVVPFGVLVGGFDLGEFLPETDIKSLFDME